MEQGAEKMNLTELNELHCNENYRRLLVVFFNVP
jgi:hypothetical protein